MHVNSFTFFSRWNGSNEDSTGFEIGPEVNLRHRQHQRMIEEIAARPRGNQNLEEWESSIDWYMVEELDFFFETVGLHALNGVRIEVVCRCQKIS